MELSSIITMIEGLAQRQEIAEAYVSRLCRQQGTDWDQEWEEFVRWRGQAGCGQAATASAVSVPREFSMTNDRSAISAVASGCAVAGPVVDKSWFGSRRAGACLVRTEVPLSAEMMVAALYCAGYFVTAEEVADGGETWGFIAEAAVRASTRFLEEVLRACPCWRSRMAGSRPPGAHPGGNGWHSAAAASPNEPGQTEGPAGA